MDKYFIILFYCDSVYWPTRSQNKGLISYDAWWHVMINPIVTHLSQAPETGHMLTGRTSRKKE